MGAEVKDREKDKDLVEKALENNEGGEEQLKNLGIFSLMSDKTKEEIEKLNLERPITKENIEAGEGVNEETTLHILKNNYIVQNPYLVRCVDDRTPDDGRYGIYAAGGTQGLIKNIISILNKSNIEHNTKKITSIVKNYIGEENYHIHSDNHSINEKGKCGCGDMNLALNDKDHVCEFNPENIKVLTEERVQAKKEGKIEVLEGSHNAKGVILIDIEDISIIPKGIEGGYFIYNQVNSNKLLKELILELNKKTSLNIDINRVLKELEQETLSTFGSLGAEAPLYRLNKKGNKFIVETDGTVNDTIINYYLGE